MYSVMSPLLPGAWQNSDEKWQKNAGRKSVVLTAIQKASPRLFHCSRVTDSRSSDIGARAQQDARRYVEVIDGACGVWLEECRPRADRSIHLHAV